MTKTVYMNIKKEMDKKGVSAYQLSKETGINQGIISRWKNGIQSPNVSNLIKLANYFDCGVEELTKGVSLDR